MVAKNILFFSHNDFKRVLSLGGKSLGLLGKEAKWNLQQTIISSQVYCIGSDIAVKHCEKRKKY